MKQSLNLFAAAKKTESKTAKSTTQKQKVFVQGIEKEIHRYIELKKSEANIKAEKEMLAGKLREVGKVAFFDMYKSKKERPESFHIADGKEQIMFICMDAYKKVEESKEAALKDYPNVLETKKVYTINPELLDKCGDAISKAIMSSKLISEEDKTNLILCTETTQVKKGTIDRLFTFKNPAQVFALIEPTVALK